MGLYNSMPINTPAYPVRTPMLHARSSLFWIRLQHSIAVLTGVAALMMCAMASAHADTPASTERSQIKPIPKDKQSSPENRLFDELTGPDEDNNGLPDTIDRQLANNRGDPAVLALTASYMRWQHRFFLIMKRHADKLAPGQDFTEADAREIKEEIDRLEPEFEAERRRNMELIEPISGEIPGPDLDNNGIRDDIDTYIANRKYTTKERKAVEQYVRSFQAILLVNAHDPVAVGHAFTKVNLAANCINSIRFATPEPGHASVASTYDTLIFNNPARRYAYDSFGQALFFQTDPHMPEETICDE